MGAMIRLQWTMYPDGFVVVRDRPPPPPRYQHLMEEEKFEDSEEGIKAKLSHEDMKERWRGGWLAPRNPNRSKSYVAEGIDQRIFLELANVGRPEPRAAEAVYGTYENGRTYGSKALLTSIRRRREESVLAFMNRWGLLDDHGPHRHFPLLIDVLIAADRLYRLVDRVQRDPASDISKSLAFGRPKPREEEALDDLLGIARAPTPRMRWAKLAGDSAPRFFLEPRNLLQFCYAEFLQIVEGGTKICSCPACGVLFMLGTVGQRRAYCSDKCRIAMHRRRQREAQQRSNVVRLRRSAGR
jgi:hypothetical protein